MKIFVRKKSSQKQYFKAFLTRITEKSFLFICVKTFGVLTASLILIFYGANLQRNQTLSSIQQIIANSFETKFSVFNNYIAGSFADADRVNIDINFEDVQVLNYIRDSAIKNGIISEKLQDISVDAKLTQGNQVFKVKLSPTGMNLDMIGSKSKRAYKVKVLNGEKIYGMSEFKLLPPNSRHNMVEWVGHELEKKENLVALRYFFIQVTLNGDDLGVYAIEEHFNKELLENNKAREGIIFSIKNGRNKKLDNKIRVFNEKKYSKDLVKNNQINLLKSAVQSIENDELEIDRFFDLEKYAKNYAIIELMGSFHAALGMNTFYYLNPVTTLVEPITREYNSLRYSDGPPQADKFLIDQFLDDKKEYFFANKLFKNKKFIELYLAEMVKVSQKKYLDDFFIEINDKFLTEQKIIHKENPFYKFPKEYMYERQSQIIAFLDKKLDVVANTYIDDKKQSSIKFMNDSLFPVQLIHIYSSNMNKESLSNVVFPGEEIIFTHSLSVSNNDLLRIGYKIHGIPNKERDTIVIPKSDLNQITMPEIWNASNNYIFSNDEIIVNDKNMTITFLEDSVNIYKDIFIPQGYLVIGKSGLEINLFDGASIYSKSAFEFIGTKSNPIKIISPDNSGGAIAILSPRTKSLFKYTIFENLSSPNKGTSGLSASVNIYSTSINFDECIFQKNQSEDFLNLIQSDYIVTNSFFNHVYSDAIDSDFSDGLISNTRFFNIGNDALDFSGSYSELSTILVDKVGDKALSAGEKSFISGEDISIMDAEIGITSKDLSKVNINYLTISNTRLGFAIFKKKEEFGAGTADISNLEIKNVDVDYLVDNNSSLFIDSIEILKKQENVADSLYGSIFGKSSK